MEISFISVGKIKEAYYVASIGNNIRELSKVCGVHNIEVADEKCPEKLSDAEMIMVKDKEGKRILEKVDPSDFVIVLAIDGDNISTVKFEKKIQQIINQGKNKIVFIIGGSLGLSKAVLSRANYKLSFSKMTFPHQLMKVILTEQVSVIMKRIR